MKRFLLSIALMGALVVFIEPARNLIAEILKLEEPATKEIEQGDWLSKIAEKNYGDTSYWRELALINRAPDADLIFPEEEVIVPSFEAIRKIRKARSLSTVNSLIEEQRDLIAARTNSQLGPVAKSQQSDSLSDSQPSRSQPSRPGFEQQERSNRSVEGSVEDSTSDRVATTSPDKKSDPYPASGDTDSATNGQDLSSFPASILVITGLILLGIVVILGVFMAIRRRRQDEERAPNRTSAEIEQDEEDDDTWQRERYTYQDTRVEEGTNGSKRRKKKVDVEP